MKLIFQIKKKRDDFVMILNLILGAGIILGSGVQSTQDEYDVYKYTIDEVKGNEIFGTEIGNDDGFGVYLLQNEIDFPVHEGDVLEVTFERGTEDNIIDVEKVEETVSEIHKIDEIKDGFVRGSLIEGTGEGVYYSENILEEKGIAEPKVGDKIKFTWTKENFDNENWEEFKAERVD